MHVHFIAIGGSAMHNLAIALKRKGYKVTGSDDEIFEPSKSRLLKEDILPEKMGWNEANINKNIDAIILGMHARKNNPELLKAQRLGLKIYSYPEFIYNQSKDKIRIVIGGSHGKTSITSMILHVMAELKIKTDFLVGALLDGFDCMVQLSDAKYIVIEGDEYLSSPIDLKPKFHWYAPHIALISGIAWDHINVFPTFENYVEQFKIFTDKIEQNGKLIFFSCDKELTKIAENARIDIQGILYDTPSYMIKEGITYLIDGTKKYPLQVFGKHNLQNILGAKLVLNQIGVKDDDFYFAISKFKGASKRLETIAQNKNTLIFKDFAHSPSKLKATVQAVKEQYPNRKLIACMELHTFSSLKKEFLPQYKNCMQNADKAYVYFNPKVVEHKKLEPITPKMIKEAFATDNVEVYTDSEQLMKTLTNENLVNTNLLLMSSGNFNGVDLNTFADNLLK
ncbi:MAG TPA: peptidoglycan synthetase [Crocinitomix sp.]|nr:peptidoglycan synthetase [Crocinitomix sp.]